MRKLLATILAFFAAATSVAAACTATKQNADYGEPGGGNTATISGSGHSSTINGLGDLLVFSAWCFPNSCTPVSLTMGAQTATLAVSGNGTQEGGGLQTGRGFIYYILSSTQTGSQTVTFTASGASGGTQVAYIDFSASAGCTFSHQSDSAVGTSTGSATANAPTISGITGDLLFNFVYTSQHVNPSAGSPWSCPAYVGSGETGDCSYNVTKNGQAYILPQNQTTSSATTNWGVSNSSTAWQSIISAFSMSQLGANQCPSGLPSGVTTCWFVAANGSDSNAGTFESVPFLHSPGMANCSATCGTVQTSFGVSGSNKPGTGLIFRGGDTWHVGNSSAVPYTGITSSCDGAGTPCGATYTWSGTSSNPFYIGVDQTWFNGASWSRPIFSGDNATSTSGVASCAHDESSLSFVFVYAVPITNVIFDNFEFTGMCWSGTSAAAKYLNMTAATNTTNRTAQNLYFHGWTHVTFNGSNLDGGTGIYNGTNRTLAAGDQFIGNVCDGADSDSESFFCQFGGGYDIHNSVFRNASNGVVINNAHVFHDNLLEHIQKTSDGVAHGNVVEFNNEFQAVNAIYNNVVRNNWDLGCAGEVQFWETPHSTDYTFNNVVYGNPCGAGNYWNMIGASGGGDSGWTANLFNNTFIVSVNTPHFAGPPSDGAVNYINNHCETPSGGTNADCSSFTGTETYTTSINQSAATDTAQGYNASQTFAYSPTQNTNATVRTGTNQQSLCTALTGSTDPLLQAAGTACQSDTGYACTYSLSTHSVTCPARVVNTRPASTAWDIGAFFFQTSGLAPPTNLHVTPLVKP